MLATSSITRQPTGHPPPSLALLERFYARLESPPPTLELMPGADLPEPYRRLLVHSCDMTPTLEAFYRQPMRLSVLGRERGPEAYLREVLLEAATSQRPVEYGVIRIVLKHLPPAARQAVLAEGRPLGTILQTQSIPHLSWPKAFFRVAADSHLCRVLGLPNPALLYGRRNLLLDSSRRLLAEVIEVLAPTADDSRQDGNSPTRHNPKSQARNANPMQADAHPTSRVSRRGLVLSLASLCVGLVSDFGFRILDFNQPGPVSHA